MPNEFNEELIACLDKYETSKMRGWYKQKFDITDEELDRHYDELLDRKAKKRDELEKACIYSAVKNNGTITIDGIIGRRVYKLYFVEAKMRYVNECRKAGAIDYGIEE